MSVLQFIQAGQRTFGVAMPVSAKTLKLLIDAGLSGDGLLRVVESIEEDSGPSKTAGARRQERYRMRHRDRGNVTRDVTSDVTRDTPPPLDAPPSFPPHPPNNPPLNPPLPIEVPAGKPPANSPKTELLASLDEARAQAVIDHRQKIRKPLTAHAAKLLAGKFAGCPDPNAAADMMIANGWQGFEAGWVENRGATGPTQGERAILPRHHPHRRRLPERPPR
jgi:hypothetical protein